jgi:hypothetical protein
MKRTFGWLFVSLFLCASTLFAVVAQKTIPLTSSLYDDVDALYLLKGLPAASRSRPWTVEEAGMIVDRLPPSLTGPESQLLGRILSVLHENPTWDIDGVTSLSLHLDANLEGYFHTNTTDYTSYLDWKYSYTERQPLLRARLDVGDENAWYLAMEAQYGYGLTARQSLDPQSSAFHKIVDGDVVGTYNTKDFPDFFGTITPSSPGTKISLYTHMFQTNVILSPNDWEYTWPKRAVFSFGGTHWNVNVSRDRLSWGNSHIGNFLYDDHLDFLDYLRFATYSPNFKFEGVYAFFTPYPNQSSDSSDETNGIETGIRMLLSHRIEFAWWNKVKFAASEGLMYYNKNGSLNASYFNPALVLHNLSDRNLFNSILVVEVDYAFVPKWNLHVEFCMDQAKSYNEEGNNDEPAAGGLSIGVSYATVHGDWIYSSDMELVATLPALYRRDGVDFVIAQRHIRLVTTEKAFYYVYDYLGFPYGGDALAFQWENSWRKDALELGATFFSMLHGPVSMFSDMDTVNAATFLGGDLTWTNVVSFVSTYEWTNHLTLVSRVDLIGKTTYERTEKAFDGLSCDAQFVESVRYTW